MLNARLAALVAVLIWISALVPPTISAQDAEGLPPGIRSVEIDGQPINAVTVPVTNNPTPEISGRVQLDVPTIELVVGDDGAIQVAAELDGRGRFSVPVPQALADGQYSLSINDLAIGSFAVDSAAQVAAETTTPRARDALLDIARVVPYPVDFGDLVPGIGFLDGRYLTLEEEAARTAAAAGETTAQSVRDTQRRLGEAGWLQRYENRLAVPNTANPETFDLQVSSFVVEYASEDHASAAFATLVGTDAEVEFPVVGDESMLTLLSGVTPDTGLEYQAARLIFRVGPMLSMIVYADLLNQQPDLTLFDTVAQIVAGRAAVVADRETVPLAAMALRLDPAPATDQLARRDIYDVRAGALTALYTEDDAIREDRIALFTGTTDAFSSTTNGTFAIEDRIRTDREFEPVAPAEPMPTSVITIEGESAESVSVATPRATQPESVNEVEEQRTAQVFATTALHAFPGDAEADAWLTANRERLGSAASGTGIFTEVPDGPNLGDDSATFESQRAIGAGEQAANGFRMYSRVGAIVAMLDISSSADLPLEDVASLMEVQIRCIEEGGCPGLASLSGRLVEFDFLEPAPPVIAEPTRTPRQERTPPPIEQPAPAPVVEPEPAPVEEPTPVPIVEPTPIPIPEPTPTFIVEPTPVPTLEPTPVPTVEPTLAPTVEPTLAPTVEPTLVPTVEPTLAPTVEPTVGPTAVPTVEPTLAPTVEPTLAPTVEPTAAPTVEPTPVPTEEPKRNRWDDDGGRDKDGRQGQGRP